MTAWQMKHRWIGHVLRHHGRLRDIVEGRMRGKPTLGRRRIQMLHDLANEMAMLHSNGPLKTERYSDTEKGRQQPAIQQKTTDNDDDDDDGDVVRKTRAIALPGSGRSLTICIQSSGRTDRQNWKNNIALCMHGHAEARRASSPACHTQRAVSTWHLGTRTTPSEWT